jgi:hypothetical protein
MPAGNSQNALHPCDSADNSDSEDNILTSSNGTDEPKKRRGRPPKNPRATRKPKISSTSEASASAAKANANIYLIDAQKKLRAKTAQLGVSTAAAAGKPYEWMHEEWLPAEASSELGEGITPENYKTYMHLKPLMKGKHCTRIMSWAPSTKRKKHTCLQCLGFPANATVSSE